jgi:hypothetical protein
VQRLIGANHQFVFKEQMIDLFGFNLLLELYEGVPMRLVSLPIDADGLTRAA